MKIIVAPDSFKGSLKSPAVARAMAAGVRAAVPGAEVVELPVGDGGEGTLEALVAATRGSFTDVSATGPLGDPLTARLGILGDGQTVFVEMAEASGLSCISPDRRDPRRADTRGTGALLRAALATGRPRVLIGIGGSATNDGGAGLLTALGVRFLDTDGSELPPGGAALAQLDRLDLSGFRKPTGAELVAACDVTNPLTGPEGASAIYGPQKGADPEDVRVLDAALARFADVAASTLGVDLRAHSGAGAAGGLGFALLAFLGARLERGVALVLETSGFAETIRGADLVLTGEGRIDRQTVAFGKTLSGLGEIVQREGVPLLALAGSLGDDLGDYRSAGLTGVGCILPRPMSLEVAMADAPRLVEDAARRMVEIFLAGRGEGRHGYGPAGH